MMASKKKITATLWDCGGVFLTNGWDHAERKKVVEHFGLDLEEFEHRHSQANDAWERGRISLQTYLAQTVFYEDRPFSENEFFHQMCSVSRVLYPEMIDFVRALRAMHSTGQGPGTYMLSNESRELMEHRIPKFGLRDLFDAYFVSAYIGLRKPERPCYRCALDVLQRQPEECIFIDDREENVAAARECGILGIRLDTPAQAIAELQSAGVALT